MDKSPKRSPKPKQKKKSVIESNKAEASEQVSETGKNNKNKPNVQKIIKGQPKQL